MKALKFLGIHPNYKNNKFFFQRMSHFASSPSLGSIDTDSISSDLEDLKSIITDDLFENHLKVRQLVI